MTQIVIVAFLDYEATLTAIVYVSIQSVPFNTRVDLISA